MIVHMWSQGSKPVACRFLDIALEVKIGKIGFNYAILQISNCLWIGHKAVNCFDAIWFISYKI